MTRLPDDSLRERILDASRELFLSAGYEQFSMRKVAGMVGCSPTAIYIHFENKMALLQQLVELLMEQMCRAFEDVVARGLSPEETLRQCARAYVDFGMQTPELYRLSFLLPISVKKPNDVYIPPGTESEKLAILFTKIVSECLPKAQRKDKQRVEIAWQSAWATMHGVTSLFITYPDFEWADLEAIKARVVESAVRGVKN